jgi:uncharacterized phiE125 gp8 family phage protein
VTTVVGHLATKLITPPAVEPFTLDEAKLHCRIDIEDDNVNIAKWIRAARMRVERDTGRALLTQTWDLFLDAFPGTPMHWSSLPWPASVMPMIAIPYPPLQLVTSVNVTDTAGAETVWSSTNYIVDTASTPGRLALTDTGAWPTATRQFQPGRIRFLAGWTSPTLIPGDLLQAVALWIGWFSEHREPVAVECEDYDRLVGPYAYFEAA